MVSKNNIKFYQARTAQQVPHYGIRKLTVGVASVLLSTTMYLGGSALVAHADTATPAPSDTTTTPVTKPTEQTAPTGQTTPTSRTTPTDTPATTGQAQPTGSVTPTTPTTATGDTGATPTEQGTPTKAPGDTAVTPANPAKVTEAPVIAKEGASAAQWTTSNPAFNYFGSKATKPTPLVVINGQQSATEAVNMQNMQAVGPDGSVPQASFSAFQWNNSPEPGEGMFNVTTGRYGSIDRVSIKPEYVALFDQIMNAKGQVNLHFPDGTVIKNYQLFTSDHSKDPLLYTSSDSADEVRGITAANNAMLDGDWTSSFEVGLPSLNHYVPVYYHYVDADYQGASDSNATVSATTNAYNSYPISGLFNLRDSFVDIASKDVYYVYDRRAEANMPINMVDSWIDATTGNLVAATSNEISRMDYYNAGKAGYFGTIPFAGNQLVKFDTKTTPTLANVESQLALSPEAKKNLDYFNQYYVKYDAASGKDTTAVPTMVLGSGNANFLKRVKILKPGEAGYIAPNAALPEFYNQQNNIDYSGIIVNKNQPLQNVAYLGHTYKTVDGTDDYAKTVLRDTDTQKFPKLYLDANASLANTQRTFDRYIVINGDQKDQQQTLHDQLQFNRQAKYDLVTGAFVEYTPWALTKGTIKDYTPDAVVTKDGTYNYTITNVNQTGDLKNVPGIDPATLTQAQIAQGGTEVYTVNLAAKPATVKVVFKDQAGQPVGEATTIDGKVGQTVDTTKVALPAGWVVAGADGRSASVKLGETNPDEVVVLAHGTQTLPAETKTVTRTITIAEPGKDAVVKTQPVQLSRTATKDTVTGETTYGPWTTTESWPEVQVPSVPGYQPSVATIPAVAVTGETTDTQVAVTYTGETATAILSYYDDNNEELLKNVVAEGHVGEPIKFAADPATAIADYEKAGYVKVSDNFTGQNFVTGKNNYEVHFKHGTQALADETKTVTRTINVKDPLTNEVKPAVQTAKFHRTATKDLVTGDVTYGEWNTDQTWPSFTTPTVAGYTADKLTVAEQAVKATDQDQTVNVAYTPVDTTEYATPEQMGLLAQLRDAVSTKPELTGLLVNELVPTLSQQKPTKVAVEKAITDAETALKTLATVKTETPAETPAETPTTPEKPTDTTEYATPEQMGQLAQLRDAVSTKPALNGLLTNELIPTLNQQKPTKTAVQKAIDDAIKALKDLETTKPVETPTTPEQPTDTTEYATPEQMGQLAQLRDAVSTKPELTGLLTNELIPTLNQTKPTKAAVQKAIDDAIKALKDLEATKAKAPTTPAKPTDTTKYATAEQMGLLAQLRDAVSTHPELNGLLYNELLPTLNQQHPTKAAVQKAIDDAINALAMLKQSTTSTGRNGDTGANQNANSGQESDTTSTGRHGDTGANQNANRGDQPTQQATKQADTKTQDTAKQPATKATESTTKQALKQTAATTATPKATMERPSRATLRAAKDQPATLPQTGNETATGAMALGLVGLTAALGMFGLLKKQQD